MPSAPEELYKVIPVTAYLNRYLLATRTSLAIEPSNGVRYTT